MKLKKWHVTEKRNIMNDTTDYYLVSAVRTKIERVTR